MVVSNTHHCSEIAYHINYYIDVYFCGKFTYNARILKHTFKLRDLF